MRVLSILTLMALIVAGCRKEHPEEPLILSPSSIECGNEGGTFEITVSGSGNWMAENLSDWIGIEKANGYAMIKVDSNHGKERECTINFTRGRQNAELLISQKRSDVFRISKTNHSSSYKEDSFEIEVECYSSWYIVNSYDWITTDIKGSDKPEKVNITIEQSFDKNQREGIIEFVCESSTVQLNIMQEQSPFISIETETMEIDGDGGVMRVLYLSNTDVEISTDADWIRLIHPDSSLKMVAFEISRNLSTTPREGHIMISSSTDKDYTQTLTIIQGEKIDHPKISFQEGTSMTVSGRGCFKLNPIFEDMSDQSLIWESDSPDIASVDTYGTVTVHTGGTCKITARNTLYKVSASITLDIMLKAESMCLMLGTQDMTINPIAVRFPGEVMEVSIIMIPADAYQEDAVCISSDPYIASVNGMKITCHNSGSATITVESLYQKLKSSFTVVVLEE